MDKIKIQKVTTSLKFFLEKEKLNISEVREVLFRVIDYVDEHYEDEKLRDKLFTNGNGNGNPYKEKIFSKTGDK